MGYERIKMIVLLVKIAYEEEVPLQIRFMNEIWTYDRVSRTYKNDSFVRLDVYAAGLINNWLNYEVEIL